MHPLFFLKNDTTILASNSNLNVSLSMINCRANENKILDALQYRLSLNTDKAYVILFCNLNIDMNHNILI